jgi:nitrite reductase/ring-hydroxylating ferredoxin subunit
MSNDDLDPSPSSAPRPGVDLAQLADGAVAKVGARAVGLSGGQPFAVSNRCRHQLADLSEGTVDADGCLVCPWHGARYDVHDGRMVQGPRGLFGYHGPTKVYGALVRSYAQLLPLRRSVARIINGRLEVQD